MASASLPAEAGRKSPNSPEKDLVSRCQNGESGAMEELIARHESRVVNCAFYFLRDYHEALDAAQDVFIILLKKIKTFRGEASFSTWLYRVTANHCLSILGHRKKRPETLGFQSEDEHEHAGPDGIQVHARKHEEEMIETVRAALERLTPKEQEVIILRHYENLSYAQISQVMGRSQMWVTTFLHRARKHLRCHLEKSGGAGQ